MTETLEYRYARLISTESDINQHLPKLAALAQEVDSVIEFGVRQGVSTTAWLIGLERMAQETRFRPSLDCYDLHCSSEVETLASLAKHCDFRFHHEDVLTAQPRAADLLFIDTLHTATQLRAELTRHANSIRHYIVLHDTTTFGQHGEGGGDGLWKAIDEFLTERPEWVLRTHYPHNNGLTVLERKEVAK